MNTAFAPRWAGIGASICSLRYTRLLALNNWGNVLAVQAKTKAGEEADRLFEEAGRKYAEALRLKPDYAPARNNLNRLQVLEVRQH